VPEAVVRLGRGDEVVTLPEADWWNELQQHLPSARARFDGLPRLHREVRRAAVLELVRTSRPVPPQAVAAGVGAPLDDVRAALAELERRLFFLVRDAAGDVSWAFPFTADVSPHRLELSSGERLYGA
jgi:hypothetical protein